MQTRPVPGALQAACYQIEHGEVHASLGLASTTYSLLRRLEESGLVVELIEEAQSHLPTVVYLKNRARLLWRTPCPKGYAHPSDLALAAYLFILAKAGIPDDGLIREVAASGNEQFFSAVRVAQQFVEGA